MDPVLPDLIFSTQNRNGVVVPHSAMSAVNSNLPRSILSGLKKVYLKQSITGFVSFPVVIWGFEADSVPFISLHPPHFRAHSQPLAPRQCSLAAKDCVWPCGMLHIPENCPPLGAAFNPSGGGTWCTNTPRLGLTLGPVLAAGCLSSSYPRWQLIMHLLSASSLPHLISLLLYRGSLPFCIN